MAGTLQEESYEFVGAKVTYASSTMKALLDRVRQVAQCDAAVLVTGESGSGKEAIARAIHQYSRRSEGPWVDINCAALPEHLVESELFGYERGAFSGADRSKPGLFELASSGTLLLDEIGDIDAKLQVKLLRVLDWGEFYRLGGVKKIKVDVRFVASTNSDLRRAVEEGRFRKDLYYRLAQVRLEVPPIRERQEDILSLLKMFCQEHRVTGSFTPPALNCLLEYSWPGNIRELRSMVIGLWGTTPADRIEPEHLPLEIQNEQRSGVTGGGSLQRLFEATTCSPAAATGFSTGLLEQAERALIETILKKTNGHQEKAAEILGISSRTLRRKLQGWDDGLSPAMR